MMDDERIQARWRLRVRVLSHPVAIYVVSGFHDAAVRALGGEQARAVTLRLAPRALNCPVVVAAVWARKTWVTRCGLSLLTVTVAHGAENLVVSLKQEQKEVVRRKGLLLSLI